MTPQEKNKQLKEKFKKQKELTKNIKLKSFSDLNIHINKETLDYWKKNR
jgi:hypothetical protein